MIKIISYYVLIKTRRLCLKFSIAPLSIKAMYALYISTFLLTGAILTAIATAFTNALIPDVITLKQYEAIIKILFAVLMMFLSFGNNNSTINEVYKEKDESYLKQLGKHGEKLIFGKYISSVFLKNILLTSDLYLSLCISLAVIGDKYRDSNVFIGIIAGYIVTIVLPVIFRFIVLGIKRRLEGKVAAYLQIMFKVLSAFISAFILSYAYINRDTFFLSKVEVGKFSIDYILNMLISFYIILLICAAVLYSILTKKCPVNSGSMSYGKNSPGLLLLKGKIETLRDKFFGFQLRIIFREGSFFHIMLESVLAIAAALSGACVNLGKSFSINILGTVLIFNLLFNSELSEVIIRKVIAIENDKFLIRHIISMQDMEKFLNSKIKTYFFMLVTVNLVLTIPGLLFGGVVNYIGIFAAAIAFSIIYALSSTISNILNPYFGNLKNEEVTESLANDILSFVLKAVNIILYLSYGAGIAPMLHLGKISLTASWLILLTIMLIHIGALVIFYKSIVRSKIWQRWEGI